MVRSERRPDQAVTFERGERDGRDHAPWVLRGEVLDLPAGARLVMHLHYGGTFFVPVLERILGDEIDRSRPRLAALAAGQPAT